MIRDDSEALFDPAAMDTDAFKGFAKGTSVKSEVMKDATKAFNS